MAATLDELYGRGRGEGSRGGLGQRGGSEAPYPSVREWSEELTTLFGPLVREEVLGAAAASGRADAALALDPATARPSIELLTTVLALAGALPEQVVEQLRPLIAKVVADLTRELATTLSPALAGIASARPTRRPGGPLDLRRTVAANLRTARNRPDGSVMIVPERPIFATRAKRTTDWRIVLVVDVSGSMEASTVWSAITAAVLSGVPALTTHLLTFSTEVVDLTGMVSDPLSLLLEVSVGGGTSIAKGLSAARALITVPSRTMVVVVSDFEEGGPLGQMLAEVRTLVDAGVHVLGCASLDGSGAPRYKRRHRPATRHRRDAGRRPQPARARPLGRRAGHVSTLPAADPLLVAETIAALPARLRAKLDGLVAGSDQWQLTGRIVRLPAASTSNWNRTKAWCASRPGPVRLPAGTGLPAPGVRPGRRSDRR
jgi:hypothetical protein